jgi:flagellar biogenesis protein FliO
VSANKSKENVMTDQKPKTWKVVLAALLDFLLVFVVGGYVIAKLTGNTNESGFQLDGGPALVLLALVVAYFWGMKRMGGTLFKRLFGLVGKMD